MKFTIHEPQVLSIQYDVDVDIEQPDDQFIQLVDNDEMKTNSSPIKGLVHSAMNGFRSGKAPELCEEGVGGTYFISDSHGDRVGVFKPLCGEPYNINNPKQFPPRTNSGYCGYKDGILVGEASLRECAAFLLDHQGFSDVPSTDLVIAQHNSFYSRQSTLSDAAEQQLSVTRLRAIHTRSGKRTTTIKLGSFQEYRDHDGNTEDLGLAFISRFPIEEVHKIALLDIRLFNTDRHAGNVLYKEVKVPTSTGDSNKNESSSMNHNNNNSKSDVAGDNAPAAAAAYYRGSFLASGKSSSVTYKLIPIDHGYTLPATLNEAWFEWMTWPQAKHPLSEKSKQYVRSLDAERDIQLLKAKFGDGFREEHFRVLRITTMFLKKCVDIGMNLFQIACMMSRVDPLQPSSLEELVAKASAFSISASSAEATPAAFYYHLSELMNDQIQQEFVNSRRRTM